MDKEKQLQAGEIVSQSLSGPDQTRRWLTGSALGVSAIFTLASRPVLAGQCMTPSSAASGNLSTHGTPPTCMGLTPAQWVALAQRTNGNDPNNPTQNGFPGGNVQFHTVFGSGSRANWGSKLLYEVMLDNSNTTNTGSTPNPISMEFAAALLNIRGTKVPANVLTEVQLIGMWSEWLSGGFFSPQAGVSWNADMIVTYLKILQA